MLVDRVPVDRWSFDALKKFHYQYENIISWQPISSKQSGNFRHAPPIGKAAVAALSLLAQSRVAQCGKRECGPVVLTTNASRAYRKEAIVNQARQRQRNAKRFGGRQHQAVVFLAQRQCKTSRLEAL
jgi:hypothetical protein